MVTQPMNTKNIFEDFLEDGRLTEPNNEKIYKLRDAIEYSKKIGRTLTSEEMLLFEICKK